MIDKYFSKEEQERLSKLKYEITGNVKILSDNGDDCFYIKIPIRYEDGTETYLVTKNCTIIKTANIKEEFEERNAFTGLE